MTGPKKKKHQTWSLMIVGTKQQHVVIDILYVFMYKGAESLRHLNWILQVTDSWCTEASVGEVCCYMCK